MPTYQYSCTKCGHEFEFFQSMTDKPLKLCPENLCGKKRWGKGRLKKLIGAGAGLIFKGSGFYITDYRSKQYQDAAKKESSATSGGDKSGGEAKSGAAETKAPKKESKTTPKKNKAEG